MLFDNLCVVYVWIAALPVRPLGLGKDGGRAIDRVLNSICRDANHPSSSKNRLPEQIQPLELDHPARSLTIVHRRHGVVGGGVDADPSPESSAGVS